MYPFFLFTIIQLFLNHEVGATTCEPEWAQFNGSCFKVFMSDSDKPVAMLEAWQLCTDEGANLASIHSREEDRFVRALIQRQYNSADNQSKKVGGGAFFIGLLLDRPLFFLDSKKASGKVQALHWTDDSPVDYGSPLVGAAADFRPGTPPWHMGNDGINGSLLVEPNNGFSSLAPSTNNNSNNTNNTYTINEICVLMLAGNRNGNWSDMHCRTGEAVGFVCRRAQQDASDGQQKVARRHSPPIATRIAPAIAVLSILVQLYVLWLVVARSPTELKDYRFFLCANTVSDLILSVVLGLLFNPDLWLPHALGGSVNGLAQHFGKYGGNISIFLTTFACSCQVFFQTFSLLFRFASIMEKQLPRLHSLINSVKARVLMVVLAVLLGSPLLSFVLLCSMDNVEKIPHFIVFYDGTAVKSFADAQQAGLPVFMIKPELIILDVALLATCFFFVQFGCLLLSLRIVAYLRSNARYYVERNYKVEMQLLLSLTTQLILPFLFIGFPLLGAAVAWKFDRMPSKLLCSVGILMFELYALVNPLMVVLFVSSYRHHTSRVAHFEVLRRLFCKRSTTVTVMRMASPAAADIGEGGQQQHQQHNGVAERRLDTIPMAWIVKE